MSNIPFPDVMGHLKTYTNTVIEQEGAWYEVDHGKNMEDPMRIYLDTKHHAVTITMDSKKGSRVQVWEKATGPDGLILDADGPSHADLMPLIIPMTWAHKGRAQVEMQKQMPNIVEAGARMRAIGHALRQG
jgi:hypothetical protein